MAHQQWLRAAMGACQVLQTHSLLLSLQLQVPLVVQRLL